MVEFRTFEKKGALVKYFDPSVETLDREQLQHLQFEKLQGLLLSIYGKNQFYTEKLDSAGADPRDIRCPNDLAQLPWTVKSELLEAQQQTPPLGSNATFPESSYTRFHQTSGTTGVPLRIIDTAESWNWFGKCWGFVLAGAGLSFEDRLFIPFSFGPFIGFWAAVEGAREVGAMMIPGGGRDSLQRLQMMKDAQATALCCTPTYALRLAEVAREHRFDLRDIPIRATIHAGEPGANIESTKARIESVWNAKCYDHAGASEVGAHSFECQCQPGGNHVIESEFIVEVVDRETGSPSNNGEVGELVATNLGRVGFPVIRYRTGDLVRWNPDICDCGRTFARFEGGVLGRADDMVVVRGVNVFPSAIENLIRRFEEVDEFRVVRRRRQEMHDLSIEIEVAAGGNGSVIRKNLAETIHHSLGLRPVVTLSARGTLPRYELKSNRFHLNQGGE